MRRLAELVRLHRKQVPSVALPPPKRQRSCPDRLRRGSLPRFPLAVSGAACNGPTERGKSWFPRVGGLHHCDEAARKGAWVTVCSKDEAQELITVRV